MHVVQLSCETVSLNGQNKKDEKREKKTVKGFGSVATTQKYCQKMCMIRSS